MTKMNIDQIKHRVNEELSEKDLKVYDSGYKDFQWGIVFNYQSKDFIETGDLNTMLYGTGVILFDKIDHSINFLCGNLLDKELEVYRSQKGYPHIIKFPPIRDIESLSDLEKVFVLMKTEELFQIEEALEIISKKNLFDIGEFTKALTGKESNNIAEDIAVSINFDTIYYYESKLGSIPNEIVLLKDQIEEFTIHHSLFYEIPDYVLELKKLKKIHIYNTPIERIPHNLVALTNLEEIILDRTLIPSKDIGKFIVPSNCTIEIEDSLKKRFNPIIG